MFSFPTRKPSVSAETSQAARCGLGLALQLSPARMTRQVEMEWRGHTGRGWGRTVGLETGSAESGTARQSPGGAMWTELATHHAAGSGDRSRPSGRAGRRDSRQQRRDTQARRAPCTPTPGALLQEGHPAGPRTLTLSRTLFSWMCSVGKATRSDVCYTCQCVDAGLAGSYCSCETLVCPARGGRASAQRTCQDSRRAGKLTSSSARPLH